MVRRAVAGLAVLGCLLGFSLPALGEPQLRPAVLLADDPAFVSLRTLSFPALDRAALALEDLSLEAAGQPPRFAVERSVFLTPAAENRWENLPEGKVRWRLRVTAASAESLNFGFSRFRLPPSAQLVIYAADGATVLGPFTAADNRPHGQLWTPVLLAEDVVLELTLLEAEKGALELTLSSINQGYRGFASPAGPDKSGSCNVDVACPEGDAYRDIIRSVARYTRSGRFLCSGAMINNTRGDFRPLFLTADHCEVSESNAATVVTYWLFENSTCRAPGSSESGFDGDGSLSKSISGSTLLAHYGPTDFSLLELSSAPPSSYRVFWAGWDAAGAAPSKGICIHHPQGDEKRISFENNPLSVASYLSNGSPGDGTHLRVADWDLGTTEPGSSGSPVFNSNKRIVGQLHGGFAACGNNDSDWFGRLAASFTGGGANGNSLRPWLDPNGSGAQSVGGSQPSSGGTPPAAPSNLAAAVVGPTQIRLSWHDNSSDETEFRIEQATGNGAFSDRGGVNANTTTVDIVSLQPQTTYRFRVRARNGSLNSAYSNTVTATTTANQTPPAAPTDLRATLNADGNVMLTWQDRSNNETGFEIQAREVGTLSNSTFTFANGAFLPTGEAGANATQALVTGVLPDHVYNFRVRAKNAAGPSPFSNQAAAAGAATTVLGACSPNANALCLLANQFRVQSAWRTSGAMGSGNAVPQSDLTGFFWFFSPSNIELVTKVLDGRALTNTYWAFSGALSDVEYWLVVTDVTTRLRRVYYNAQGNICGVGDTAALPASAALTLTHGAQAIVALDAPTAELPRQERGLEALELLGEWDEPTPRQASGTCAPGPTRLCLLEGRFAVTVTWRNQHDGGTTGVGGAVPDPARTETGYFWFFSPSALELVTKVLDGRAINGKFWVFFGGLSDVEYDLTVTDTLLNHTKTYHNAPGNICGGADTQALDGQ